ncbi:Fe-S cluster assembly protein SufD [Aureimonas jatrophae]|uniref:Iron-regulated ABC transporter permease protein SufD n=1 Tax=Aureimonas jatrophae TaxID=1166073 RepID=A0A1H0ME83_9HYPH|nr:Fe-S cluster assembly protein SufD [Aureimonas jatrophae]MBB3951091.1 Fe-S cluster assembly protein SufD [Aureimonas jatrophae]SDO78714.1 Iron-regulated ABC transporter permease protein SufD [Aureimonas jatrophae]
MSVANLPVRTQAELALIERADHAGALADGRRQEALDLLRQNGLPSRRVEAWHYTDLRALLGRQAAPSGARTDASFLSPFLPHSVVVDLGRGAAGNDVARGVSVTQGYSEPSLEGTANRLDRDFDTVRVLNAALGAGASTVTVAADTDVETPIELRSLPHAGGSQGASSVVLGENSKAVIVERAPAEGAGAVSTAVHTLELGARADILWIVVQEKGFDETHLAQLNVRCATDAKFRMFVLNAGGAVIRQEVHVETAGEGAAIVIRGVNLLADNQHVDVTTTLNHNAANTTSTEIFRNVVLGGHGVFQGVIRVAKGAQKTDARLACNTLLLADDGDFSAKPELEIFADDVQCGHGATAGEINADHLFYLMSRGIPQAQARALLVKAFVDEVVEEIEHEAAVEALEARIDEWLATER